jgi:ubiquinone/menaquinone biosynthesis C-methylase UbiE
MRQHGIHLSQHRIEGQEQLPFEDNFFDVVSMLAVFEHIEPGLLVGVHREVYRVLKPGGMYVMTTPAVWTGGILWLLGKLRLISGNISEHKGSYNRSMVFPVLQKAGFEKGSLKFGLFELFMNTWTTAVK